MERRRSAIWRWCCARCSGPSNRSVERSGRRPCPSSGRHASCPHETAIQQAAISSRVPSCLVGSSSMTAEPPVVAVSRRCAASRCALLPRPVPIAGTFAAGSAACGHDAMLPLVVAAKANPVRFASGTHGVALNRDDSISEATLFPSPEGMPRWKRYRGCDRVGRVSGPARSRRSSQAPQNRTPERVFRP